MDGVGSLPPRCATREEGEGTALGSCRQRLSPFLPRGLLLFACVAGLCCRARPFGDENRRSRSVTLAAAWSVTKISRVKTMRRVGLSASVDSAHAELCPGGVRRILRPLVHARLARHAGPGREEREMNKKRAHSHGSGFPWYFRCKKRRGCPRLGPAGAKAWGGV